MDSNIQKNCIPKKMFNRFNTHGWSTGTCTLTGTWIFFSTGYGAKKQKHQLLII